MAAQLINALPRQGVLGSADLPPLEPRPKPNSACQAEVSFRDHFGARQSSSWRERMKFLSEKGYPTAAKSPYPGAALVKAVDQTSNMNSIVNTPPYWLNEERLAYVAKARTVVAGLKIPPTLATEFEKAATAAERTD